MLKYIFIQNYKIKFQQLCKKSINFIFFNIILLLNFFVINSNEKLRILNILIFVIYIYSIIRLENVLFKKNTILFSTAKFLTQNSMHHKVKYIITF